MGEIVVTPERLTEIQEIIGRSRENTDDKADLFWACRDLLARVVELEKYADTLREIAALTPYVDASSTSSVVKAPALARAALDRHTQP